MHARKLLSVALLALAPLATASAQQITGVGVEPAQAAIGQSVSITVQIDARGGSGCGLTVDFGDGSTQDVRVGANDAPLRLSHGYASAGRYSVGVSGKLIIRGLRSMLPCDGSAKSAPVAVGQAQAAPAAAPAPAAAAPHAAPAAAAGAGGEGAWYLRGAPVVRNPYTSTWADQNRWEGRIYDSGTGHVSIGFRHPDVQPTWSRARMGWTMAPSVLLPEAAIAVDLHYEPAAPPPAGISIGAYWGQRVIKSYGVDAKRFTENNQIKPGKGQPGRTMNLVYSGYFSSMRGSYEVIATYEWRDGPVSAAPPAAPPVSQPAAPAATPSAPSVIAWTPVGRGDCPGRDVGSSTGATPDPGKCDAAFAGFTAVCWPTGCTYKNMATASCTGGANPGNMYTCGTSQPGAIAPPAPPPVPASGWTSVGRGDCPGRDVGSSVGATPVPGKCEPAFAGFTAVCWPTGCTYKNVPTASCTGGANPGNMYTCNAGGSGSTASAPPTGGGATANLARGKPTTQSSVYRGTGLDQGPHFGVDGILTPTPRDPYQMVHTNADSPAWWQVDLGAVHRLSQLRLYNRIGCCQDRARTVQVLLSTDGANWQAAYSHDGSVFREIAADLGGRSARFVRLQLRERNYLHFMEVEVYGQ